MFIRYIILVCLPIIQAVTISSVSTSLTDSAPLKGSVMGGTTIYIRGTGFSTLSFLNSAKVGPYTCDTTQYGANPTMLVCDTVQATSSSYRANLQISATVISETASCCSFKYDWSYTPQLERIIPRSAVAGQIVNFYGVHRITNLGDIRDFGQIRSLKTGYYLCNRLDRTDDDIRSHSNQMIPCELAQFLAGFYPVEQWVSVGKARNSPAYQTTDFHTKKNYYFKKIPAITKISSDKGLASGTVLTIDGTGFSNSFQNPPTVIAAGIKCLLKTIKTNQIICTVGQNFNGNTMGAIPFAGGAAETDRYIQGMGLQWNLYGTYGSSSALKSAIQSGLAGTKSVLLQPFTYKNIQNANGQFIRGYFKAPKTGKYVFYLLADSSAQVYMSTVPGTADKSKLQKLVWCGSSTYHDYNYFYSQHFNGFQNIKKQISLNQNEYYYMEAYHNMGGNRLFRLAVQIENTDESFKNLAFPVHTLKITKPYIPQIIDFIFLGNIQASFSLKMLQKNLATLKIEYERQVVLNKQTTGDKFANQMAGFPGYGSKNLRGSKMYIDQNGDQVSNVADAKGIKFILQVHRWRYSKPYPDCIFKQGKCSIVQSQEHSPPITGTFQFSVNGIPVQKYESSTRKYSNPNIPSDVSAYDLANMIKAIGISYTHVDRVGIPQDGTEYLILFNGASQELTLQMDGFNLQGGTGPAVLTSQQLRKGSKNILYDPIPSSFLFSPSQKPAVEVYVNEIMAACIDECQFQIVPGDPIVTRAQLMGSLLNMTIDSNGLDLNFEDLQVQFAGSTCTNLVGDFTQFTCQLEQYSTGVPRIEAGNQKPIVYQLNYGRIKCQQIIDVNLNGNGPTISVSPQGGIDFQIAGNTVPLASYNTRYYETVTPIFQYCDANTTMPYKFQQGKVIVTLPKRPASHQSQTSCQLILHFNTKELLFTINFITSTPDISSIFPQTSSPVQKKDITITGNGFGSNKDDITVWLYQNGNRKYQLGIASVTETTIVARLGGGRTGEYQVVVQKIGQGRGTGHPFKYQILVTQVLNNKGSNAGGRHLILKGNNFQPANNLNQVFIGDQQLSIMCSIISVDVSSTPNVLECSMPKKQDSFEGKQGIYLTGRLIQQSICNDGLQCKFQYLDQMTPKLTSGPSQFNWQQQVTLIGQFFDQSASHVDINNTIVKPISKNQTHIIFKAPKLPQASYPLRVWIQGYGYAQNQITVSVPLVVQSQILGSTEGGIFNLVGSGFSIQKISIPPTSVNTLIQVCQKTCKKIVYKPSQDNTPQYTLSQADLRILQNSKPTDWIINQIYLESDHENITCILSNSASIALNCNLKEGQYKVRLLGNYGFAKIKDDQLLIRQNQQKTLSVVEVGILGKQNYIINGNQLSQHTHITVCGRTVASKQLVNSNELNIKIPPFINQALQSNNNIVQAQVLIGTPFADQNESSHLPFDQSYQTIYKSKNNECYFGLQFGNSQIKAQITMIRYFPNPTWINVYQYLKGAKIQISQDNSTWTLLHEIDGSVHSGWNYFKFEKQSINYIKVSHNSASNCKIGSFEVYGYLLNTNNSPLPISCPIILGQRTYTDKITYSMDKTPIIEKISPNYGSIAGGYQLEIQGTFQSTGSALIYIDGNQCTLISITNTKITCTVSKRNIKDQTGFKLTIDDNLALNKDFFLYAERWSDQATWGYDIPPVQGDLIHIPKGMTLLVDESTPVLLSVVVQGTIIFADEKNLVFNCGSMIVQYGRFIAGTEKQPFQHTLTFVHYGGYYDRQSPIYGNKGIACYKCQFDMHGIKRQPTWTMLQTTVNKGQNTITLMDQVDWKVGQTIVIASSSQNHLESQRRIITAVSPDLKTLTLDIPFRYNHFSVVQTYNGEEFPMRCQVGLLSRNVKMQGDPSSTQTKYGSHLMMIGETTEGLIGKISYTQFTRCGQPTVVGRYCIHFHMNGAVVDSYVQGNAVYDSFARILTLHGVHYLRATKNVGHMVQGHNFFVQDGIETHNLIQHNLVISSLESWTMLQTDISVASFWITNPSNDVRNNHAAGGDFYGFWYQIKAHPDGPSSTLDVCPRGMRLGDSKNNVAHSYKRFGLRILTLASRQFPCQAIRNNNLRDPWKNNPSILSTFENYTLFKNKECGFLGQNLGNVLVKNFRVADSNKGGLQFHKTNMTKQNVTIDNALVVGQSNTNGQSGNSAKGIIVARTDGLLVKNIRFFNFKSGQTPFQSCSQCHSLKLAVSGGKATFFQNIQYNNIQGSFITWANYRRQIFHDLDGTLTTKFAESISQTWSSATLIPYFKHNDIPGICYKDTTKRWDNSLLCSPDVTVRKLLIGNMVKSSWFNLMPLRIQRMDTDVVSQDLADYSQLWFYKIKSGDVVNSWAAPFVTGYKYHMHWKRGIDFEHMAVDPSFYYAPQQPGIILQFNYTDNRQLFEIGHLITNKLELPFIPQHGQPLQTSTCQLGQYTNNVDDRIIQVCISGKNMQKNQWLDVNGIRCRYLCPVQGQDFVKQNFVRLWSNQTQWPDEELPVAGENVTIPGPWNLVMDMNPPQIQFLEINGDLFFQQNVDRTLIAKNIWVRAGSIKIGAQGSVYQNQARIILKGEKNDRYVTMDPDMSGNKMLAVSGSLEFYGKSKMSWTKLKSNAYPKQNQIQLLQAPDWSINDKIIISPSNTKPQQYQQVTITAINSNKVTFTPPLKYFHFGGEQQTIQNQYGTLDMRTTVGHLTKNIKIQGQNNGWGCRVMAFGMRDGEKVRKGNIIFQGVEIQNCGQFDTDYSALDFRTLPLNPGKTIIKKSSIHNCVGWCVHMETVDKITMTQNVIAVGRKYLVQANSCENFQFTKNLLIGANTRPQMTQFITSGLADIIGCFQQYTIAQDQNGINVSQNICQGSKGFGFAFPHVDCSKLSSNKYINNIAGTSVVGFIYNKNGKASCQGANKISAYNCKIGFMANPGTRKVQFQQMMFADNERAVTLRFAGQSSDSSGYFRNSWISALARDNCADCYKQSRSFCRNQQAIRLLSVTKGGQGFPLKSSPTSFDVICNAQTYDSKAYLFNIQFQNYRQSYPNHPDCKNNKVFKRHSGASDMTAGHYLTNTKCINCDQNSYGYFAPPSPGWLGWFGGCGNFQCTGPNNYIIHDQTGDFLGFKGQLLPNNRQIGDKLSDCRYIQSMNGHLCQMQRFGVLQYESIAHDFNKRMVWPITLFNQDNLWTSKTNAWRQWQWDGPEPLNQRIGRFISVVELNKIYNLTYVSQPPSDARYQIQKRNPLGQLHSWVILKIYYPVPYTIQVYHKNTLVKSFRPDQNQDLKNHKQICGANTYFYFNQTIHFVVNGQNNCQIRTKISSSLQLTARFNTTIQDFFQDNHTTTFIDRITALLGIDYSRVKIVGIRQGSVIVTAHITTELKSNLENSTLQIPNVQADKIQLDQYKKKLEGNTQIFSDIGELLQISFQTHIIGQQKQQHQQNQQEKIEKNNAIIGLIIGIGIGTILLIIFIILLIRAAINYKKAKIIVDEASQIVENNEKKIVVTLDQQQISKYSSNIVGANKIYPINQEIQ